MITMSLCFVFVSYCDIPGDSFIIHHKGCLAIEEYKHSSDVIFTYSSVQTTFHYMYLVVPVSEAMFTSMMCT